MEFRQATNNDIIDLCSLVLEYCEENKLNYNQESIMNYINFQLRSLPCFVAIHNKEIVGAISWVLVPDAFDNKTSIAKKIACFVSKDFRAAGTGTELLKLAEAKAKEAGAKRFYYSSTASPEGYNAFETEYVREL